MFFYCEQCIIIRYYIIQKGDKMKQDNNRLSVESQLECKATGSMSNQIANDLEAKDKPLADILEEEKDEEEEGDEEEEEKVD